MVKYVGEDGEEIKPQPPKDPDADPPMYMPEPTPEHPEGGPPRPMSPKRPAPPPEPDPPEFMPEPTPGHPEGGPPRPMSPISHRPPPEPDPPMYMPEPTPEHPEGGPPRPMSPVSAGPPPLLHEPGPEDVPAPAGPSLQGEDLDGIPIEALGGHAPAGSRPGPFKAGCLAIPAILVAILLIMWILTGGGDEGASDEDSTKATTSSTTEEPASKPAPNTGGDDIHYSATAPAKDALPAGEELYTGESGDNIGFIAGDGQSRFLSITAGPGVGVGNATMVAKSTTWPKSGKITGFGVKLGTSSNPGRYGFNIFITNSGTPPGTYSAGCSMEVGQTSCFAVPENIKGTPPINAGEALTIIIGEEGHVEQKGAFPVTWWMTFKPS